MTFTKPGANPSRPARISTISPERLMRVPFCGPHERVFLGRPARGPLAPRKMICGPLVRRLRPVSHWPFKIINPRALIQSSRRRSFRALFRSGECEPFVRLAWGAGENPHQNVTAHRASSIAATRSAITNPILTNGSSVMGAVR
jgi:hypothetical protein